MGLPSLQLLEALIAISESSCLAQAANKLNLTPPALSLQLKRLEGMFELPLFEFQGKRKVLTPYGRSICFESKKLIDYFRKSFEEIDRLFLDPERQTLRVSGRRELMLQAKKVLDFKGTISFSIMSSEEALQALYNKQTDVAISRIKPDSPDLIAKKFISNCRWLVVHEKWIKGESTRRIVEDKEFFQRTPAIIYNSSAVLLDEWLNYLGLEVRRLNVKVICEDWLTILQMVETGEGYAVIPDSIESNLKSVKHIELPLGPVTSQTYYFLFYKDLRKFPAYRNLFKL